MQAVYVKHNSAEHADACSKGQPSFCPRTHFSASDLDGAMLARARLTPSSQNASLRCLPAFLPPHRRLPQRLVLFDSPKDPIHSASDDFFRGESSVKKSDKACVHKTREGH